MQFRNDRSFQIWQTRSGKADLIIKMISGLELVSKDGVTVILFILLIKRLVNVFSCFFIKFLIHLSVSLLSAMLYFLDKQR